MCNVCMCRSPLCNVFRHTHEDWGAHDRRVVRSSHRSRRTRTVLRSVVRIYDYVHRALWCVESVCNIPLFDLISFPVPTQATRADGELTDGPERVEWSIGGVPEQTRRTSTKIRQAKSEALHLSLLVFTFGGTGLTSLCYTPLSCTGTSRFKFKLLLQVRPGLHLNAVDRFININRQPNKYYGKPRDRRCSRG